MKVKFIVGIDEVGRGSLAGPVAVAAVLLPRRVRLVNRALGKLKDSKKLTPKRREEWHAHLKSHPRLRYAVARVYPRGIERMNISRAANLAALRAFRRLAVSAKGGSASGGKGQLSDVRCRVLLDGGLYLGNGPQPANARTIVRGDEKFAAIKAASIIAKVSRDRFMRRLATKHPRYGFDAHKGYGTKMHLAALRRYGPTEAHRLTFLP